MPYRGPTTIEQDEVEVAGQEGWRTQAPGVNKLPESVVRTMADVDRYHQLYRQNNPIIPRPVEPEEDPGTGWMEQLSGVFRALDSTGRMSRRFLAGQGLVAPDWLDPSGGDKGEFTGSDLLTAWGWKDDGGFGRKAVGYGLEALLDPINLIPGVGLGYKLTKGVSGARHFAREGATMLGGAVGAGLGMAAGEDFARQSGAPEWATVLGGGLLGGAVGGIGGYRAASPEAQRLHAVDPTIRKLDEAMRNVGRPGGKAPLTGLDDHPLVNTEHRPTWRGYLAWRGIPLEQHQNFLFTQEPGDARRHIAAFLAIQTAQAEKYPKATEPIWPQKPLAPVHGQMLHALLGQKTPAEANKIWAATPQWAREMLQGYTRKTWHEHQKGTDPARVNTNPIRMGSLTEFLKTYTSYESIPEAAAALGKDGLNRALNRFMDHVKTKELRERLQGTVEELNRFQAGRMEQAGQLAPVAPDEMAPPAHAAPDTSPPPPPQATVPRGSQLGSSSLKQKRRADLIPDDIKPGDVPVFDEDNNLLEIIPAAEVGMSRDFDRGANAPEVPEFVLKRGKAYDKLARQAGPIPYEPPKARGGETRTQRTAAEEPTESYYAVRGDKGETLWYKRADRPETHKGPMPRTMDTLVGATHPRNYNEVDNSGRMKIRVVLNLEDPNPPPLELIPDAISAIEDTNKQIEEVKERIQKLEAWIAKGEEVVNDPAKAANKDTNQKFLNKLKTEAEGRRASLKNREAYINDIKTDPVSWRVLHTEALEKGVKQRQGVEARIAEVKKALEEKVLAEKGLAANEIDYFTSSDRLREELASLEHWKAELALRIRMPTPDRTGAVWTRGEISRAKRFIENQPWQEFFKDKMNWGREPPEIVVTASVMTFEKQKKLPSHIRMKRPLISVFYSPKNVDPSNPPESPLAFDPKDPGAFIWFQEEFARYLETFIPTGGFRSLETGEGASGRGITGVEGFVPDQNDVMDHVREAARFITQPSSDYTSATFPPTLILPEKLLEGYPDLEQLLQEEFRRDVRSADRGAKKAQTSQPTPEGVVPIHGDLEPGSPLNILIIPKTKSISILAENDAATARLRAVLHRAVRSIDTLKEMLTDVRSKQWLENLEWSDQRKTDWYEAKRQAHEAVRAKYGQDAKLAYPERPFKTPPEWEKLLKSEVRLLVPPGMYTTARGVRDDLLRLANPDPRKREFILQILEVPGLDSPRVMADDKMSNWAYRLLAQSVNDDPGRLDYPWRRSADERPRADVSDLDPAAAVIHEAVRDIEESPTPFRDDVRQTEEVAIQVEDQVRLADPVKKEDPKVLNIRDLSGQQIPEGAVYVGRGRGSRWGNPFTHRPEAAEKGLRLAGSAEEAVSKYQEYILSRPELMNRLHELQGKDLVCWCSPGPCHADVLLRLANGLDTPATPAVAAVDTEGAAVVEKMAAQLQQERADKEAAAREFIRRREERIRAERAAGDVPSPPPEPPLPEPPLPDLRAAARMAALDDIREMERIAKGEVEVAAPPDPGLELLKENKRIQARLRDVQLDVPEKSLIRESPPLNPGADYRPFVFHEPSTLSTPVARPVEFATLERRMGHGASETIGIFRDWTAGANPKKMVMAPANSEESLASLEKFAAGREVVSFTGHRDFSSTEAARKALENIAAANPDAVWVHGGAKGFDSFVGDFADKNKIAQVVIRPAPGREPVQALLTRNQFIVDGATTTMFGWWNREKKGGTWNATQRAQLRESRREGFRYVNIQDVVDWDHRHQPVFTPPMIGGGSIGSNFTGRRAGPGQGAAATPAPTGPGLAGLFRKLNPKTAGIFSRIKEFAEHDLIDQLVTQLIDPNIALRQVDLATGRDPKVGVYAHAKVAHNAEMKGRLVLEMRVKPVFDALGANRERFLWFWEMRRMEYLVNTHTQQSAGGKSYIDYELPKDIVEYEYNGKTGLDAAWQEFTDTTPPSLMSAYTDALKSLIQANDDWVLKPLWKAGVINEVTFDQLKGTPWLPFYREWGFAKGKGVPEMALIPWQDVWRSEISATPSHVKRISQGSELPFKDSLQEWMRTFLRVQTVVAKAATSNNLVEALIASGTSGNQPFSIKYGTLEELELQNVRPILPNHSMSKREDFASVNAFHFFSPKRPGVRQLAVFDDPQVASAILKVIHAQERQDLGGVARVVASALTGAVRLGATALNLNFLPHNMIRDWAQMYVAEGIAPWDKRYRDAFISTAKRGKDWVEAGAAGSFGGNLSIALNPQGIHRVTDITKHVRWENGKIVLDFDGVWDVLTFLPRLITEPIMRANEIVEQAPRVATFQKSKQTYIDRHGAMRGWQEEILDAMRTEGASRAMDVTVDFSKMGDAVHRLAPFILFLNPTIQGGVNVVKGMTQTESRRRAYTLMSIAVVGELMQATWNSAFFGEGAHAAITEEDSERKWNFIIGQTDAPPDPKFPNQRPNPQYIVLRIPKDPYSLVAGNPIRKALEQQRIERGFESYGDFGRWWFLNTIGASVGGAVSAAQNLTPVGGGWSGIIPPAGNALVGQLANRDLFRDSPIEPPNLSDQPAEYRYFPHTPKTVVWLTTGVTEFSRRTGMSPAMADHALRTMLAGIYTQPAWLTDMALNLFGVDVPTAPYSQMIQPRSAAEALARTPGVGGFIGVREKDPFRDYQSLADESDTALRRFQASHQLLREIGSINAVIPETLSVDGDRLRLRPEERRRANTLMLRRLEAQLPDALHQLQELNVDVQRQKILMSDWYSKIRRAISIQIAREVGEREGRDSLVQRVRESHPLPAR